MLDVFGHLQNESLDFKLGFQLGQLNVCLNESSEGGTYQVFKENIPRVERMLDYFGRKYASEPNPINGHILFHFEAESEPKIMSKPEYDKLLAEL